MRLQCLYSMEFNLLISAISCKFEMFIFEMALVTKHDVQFAFLFVYTVLYDTLESCSYKTLYAEVLSWFII